MSTQKQHLKTCGSHPDSKHYHQPCSCDEAKQDGEENKSWQKQLKEKFERTFDDSLPEYSVEIFIEEVVIPQIHSQTLKQGKEEMKAEIISIINKIEVSGGGSGRRLKEMLLNKLNEI